MASQNMLMGDSFTPEIPQTAVQQDQLAEERSMARFSKSKEFKKLKEYADARIAFYQTCLPDGRPITAVDADERAQMWVIANAVIGEFNMLISQYEAAAEVVKNG